MPLRDGRVRLTARDDLLSSRAMRAIEELLAQRAADRISDDRLLAEAVSAVAGARGPAAHPRSTTADPLHVEGRDLRRPG
ncbi:hypothetical protein ACWEOO_20455, partial [Kribbella sp. NPDC004138]